MPYFHKEMGRALDGSEVARYWMDLPGHGTVWMAKDPRDVGGCRLSSAMPGESRWIWSLKDLNGNYSEQRTILGTFANAKAQILRRYGY